MLIRSQDKLMSVSYETGLWLIVGNEVRYLSPYNINFYMTFGTYKSQDAAIKVLDKIQMANFRAEKMKMIYSYTGHLANSCIQDFTFQMPSDEESEEQHG